MISDMLILLLPNTSQLSLEMKRWKKLLPKRMNLCQCGKQEVNDIQRQLNRKRRKLQRRFCNKDVGYFSLDMLTMYQLVSVLKDDSIPFHTVYGFIHFVRFLYQFANNYMKTSISMYNFYAPIVNDLLDFLVSKKDDYYNQEKDYETPLKTYKPKP